MKPPITSADFLLWRWAGALALSPDGAQLAYVEQWSDAGANENRSAIWLVPTDGSERPRQVTRGPRRDVAPHWSPDGRRLAFLSNRETDWRSDLYVLDLARGGEPELVARLPRGITEHAWLDDARLALVGRPEYPAPPWNSEAGPEERRRTYGSRRINVSRLHHRLDGAGFTDDEAPWLWVLNLDEGAEPQPVLRDEFDLSRPAATPDGRIAFLSCRDSRADLTWHDQVWAISPDGGSLEQLSQAPGQVVGYAFLAGGGLAYVSAPEPGLPLGCKHHLLFVGGQEVSGGGLSLTKSVLAETVDVVQAPSTPTSDGESIYALATERGACHVWRWSEQRGLERVIDGRRVVGEVAAAGGRLAFTSTSLDEAATIRVCGALGDQELLLHTVNPWLEERDAGGWRELCVQSEAHETQGWALLPPGFDPAEPPAGVLHCHGGPHAAYGHAYNMFLRPLAGAGYTVVFGNPPGSTGYGEEFAQLNHGAWGEADLPALEELCAEAQRQSLAGAERWGVTGGSYGGFLTLWAVTHSDRFQAAVAARPPSLQDSLYGTSEFGWALLGTCLGAQPWEDPDLYRRLSPATYVDRVNVPLRLIACTDDHRVDLEQSEEMYVRLKVLEREVDMVVFRGGHALILHGPPWSRRGHMEAVVEWFERHLPA